MNISPTINTMIGAKRGGQPCGGGAAEEESGEMVHTNLLSHRPQASCYTNPILPTWVAAPEPGRGSTPLLPD